MKKSKWMKQICKKHKIKKQNREMKNLLILKQNNAIRDVKMNKKINKK